jgi:hypothetical protein
MNWLVDKDNPRRAVLNWERVSSTVSGVDKEIHDAIKWGNKNKIMVWRDTFCSVRFANKKDVTWFMLGFA